MRQADGGCTRRPDPAEAEYFIMEGTTMNQTLKRAVIPQVIFAAVYLGRRPRYPDAGYDGWKTLEFIRKSLQPDAVDWIKIKLHVR